MARGSSEKNSLWNQYLLSEATFKCFLTMILHVDLLSIYIVIGRLLVV